MKKALAAVFALSLASSASAVGNIGVEFGTNWYKVNYTDNVSDHLQGQGQTVLVTWTLENDLSLGAYSESGTWVYDGSSFDTWEVTAIQVSKGIVKNVAVGFNLGKMYETWDDYDALLTDVFGSVVILGGSGDKVSGTLKSTIGVRFAPSYDADYDYTGITVGLALGLLF